MKIEDIGNWVIHDVDRELDPSHPWGIVIEVGDGKQHDVRYKFNTPGAALNYMQKWAKDRGAVITMPQGLIRRVVSEEEVGTV